MNDLYSLNRQLENLYNRIPLYERENDLDSPQKDEYNKALQEFIECGEKVFGEDNLDLEQINARIQEHSILAVKAMLAHEPQDIYASIPEMDNIASDAFTRLEYCLSCRRENPRDFYEDDNFASDRKFLSSFNEEDIASFERFQDYIRNTPDKATKSMF